ncbi:MAG: hypothetical protein GWO24_20485, partial [Akkermansiaceae bacterium]|nr:hypothetical protein [Akkermansiaceae bacterium]
MKTAISLILLATAILQAQEVKQRYAIAIHGGAGSAPSTTDADSNIAHYEGLKRALEAGVG